MVRVVNFLTGNRVDPSGAAILRGIPAAGTPPPVFSPVEIPFYMGPSPAGIWNTVTLRDLSGGLLSELTFLEEIGGAVRRGRDDWILDSFLCRQYLYDASAGIFVAGDDPAEPVDPEKYKKLALAFTARILPPYTAYLQALTSHRPGAAPGLAATVYPSNQVRGQIAEAENLTRLLGTHWR
jgi:hypothetical protein